MTAVRLFSVLCLFTLLMLGYEHSGLHIVVYEGLQNYPGEQGNVDILRDIAEEEVHSMCQAARLKRFQNTCEELRSSYNFQNVDDFSQSEMNSLLGTIDDEHKFIMEAFPKTGCSSWNVVIMNNTAGTYLNPARNLNPHAIEHNFGLRYFRDETKEVGVQKLKDYFVMINVRHPFKRLESAYKDKFFRVTSYEISLLDKLHKNSSNLNSSHLMDNRITFEEFLDHILNDNLKNNHWRPFFDFKLCSQYINYIARTESALTDMSYIINHHLSKKGDPVKTHSTGSEGLHYTTMDLPFFSAMSDPQKYIDKLKPFHDDFKLFGYNYKIDSTGKVTGSCDNIINGMCC